MDIKDMPCVTVEQVLRLREAAIKLEAELATAKQQLTAYEITVKNLEAKLAQSDEALLSIGDKLTAKCRDMDLLKSSLPKIKADAVCELILSKSTDVTIEGISWAVIYIEDAHEYANQLEAGE